MWRITLREEEASTCQQAQDSKSKVGRVGWVMGGKLSPISNSVRRYFKIQRDVKLTK